MTIDTDPSTQQHTMVVVCIVSPIVSSLFVAMRLWTRAFVTHSLGRDDYTALVTLPFCIAYSALTGLGTNYGFGWHTTDLPPDGYVAYEKWIYISSLVYLFSLGLYKFTILLLYLRLFGVNKNFRHATWTVMFFVFAYLFSNVITLAFGCHPIERYWNSAIPGHCIAETKAGLGYGSMNFISDIIIFVLPLPMVWRLKLSRRNKIGVTLVFMGGITASVVAVVRYAFLLRRYFATDTVWYDGKNMLWMVLEVNTGLICSCTLAFKPFFRYFASSSFCNYISRGMISHTKNNVPPERRNNSGPLVQQNTGDKGFVMLKDDGMEMNDSHTRIAGVVHNTEGSEGDPASGQFQETDNALLV